MATRTNAQDATTQGTAGYLGYAPIGWGTCTLNGTLDEVRLAAVARSAGWIATEYENQKSPQTFYAVRTPAGALTRPHSRAITHRGVWACCLAGP